MSTEALKLEVEARNLEVEAGNLEVIGNYAEANKLYAQANKLYAQAEKEEREENSPLQDTEAFEEEVRKQNERLDCVAKMGVVLTFFTQGAQIVSMTVYRLLSQSRGEGEEF